MLRLRTVTPILIGGLLTASCGTDEPGSIDGAWRAETETLGDTVVVRTLSGSRWGSARLVEELRIGRIEGGEHEMCGRPGALAVTPGGDILVYDAQATALRRFGADGRYIGTIGGAGSGPGEYRNVAGMAVLEDGRIVVNDFGNGRFNVFAPDGSPQGMWPVRPSMAAMRPLHLTPDGSVFLHDTRRPQGGGAPEEVLVRLDRAGEPRDTLLLPDADYRPPGLEVRTEHGAMGTNLPFAPTRHWSVTPGGELVTMVGDRYAVHVHGADGSVLRITRVVDPVPVSPEERVAEVDRVTQLFRRSVEGWRWDGPSIPATKPPIQWLHTGRDGSIWVRIARPGTPIPEAARTAGARTFVREPVVFDVFESDGVFLGQVHAPPGLQLAPHPILDRDHVWAVMHDDDGVSFVARLRIIRGDGR
jgi:hypothetical protein